MVTHHVMCSYICDWFAVTFEAQDLLRFTAWLVFFFEWTVKTVFEALFYKVESAGKINSFCANLAWDKTTTVIARAVNETTTLYTVPENTSAALECLYLDILFFAYFYFYFTKIWEHLVTFCFSFSILNINLSTFSSVLPIFYFLRQDWV